MRIAISGASGLIGSALVPALVGAGHDVVRLVRHESRGADEIAWDPAGGRLEPGALAGVDAVVSLSGANLDRRWTERSKREIVDSRVATTALLARTMASAERKPSAFVVAGGVGIYGDRGDEILTEESGLGSGFLADLGKAWEAAAAPAREAGIRTVSFRQGVVLSRDGGALRKMLTPFKLGLGGRVGSGRQWWSWISAEDVVAGYRLALESELSGPVNLTSPNPATSEQFTKALGRALGRPTVFPLPGLVVKTLFGERGEAVLLEGQRTLPKRLVDDGFEFAHPDVSTAIEHALSK